MSRAAPAALFLLMAVCACGKVGPPQPPIIRTPEAIRDLRAVQGGYKVTLIWTNPGHYIDNNPATDLAVAHVLQNGIEVKTLPISGADKPQSYEIDVSNSLDNDMTFSVQVETERRRVSFPATVAVRAVEVPGSPRDLKAVVDQFRITLTWEAPERNPDLVGAYIVQRDDRPASIPVHMTRFEDAEYEPDKMYVYTVTATRGADGSVPGLAGISRMVTATDKTKPKTPVGLEIQAEGTGVVSLKWTPNDERDKKEYLVYRSDQSEPIATTPVELYVDQSYRSGLSYQLVAVDFFGNESPRSAPVAGPLN